MSTDTMEMTDTERMLNLGVEIQLKKLGKVIVKELAFEDLVLLGKEVIAVFKVLDFSILKSEDSAEKGFGFLQELLGKPETMRAIQMIAAYATERKPEDFEKMGPADWLKLVKALKQVTDWEETKELFLELVPEGFLAKMQDKELLASFTNSEKLTGGGSVIP